MEVYHLYSGGKDSSLAAYILSRLGYNVILVTINFGLLDSWKYAKETAERLGFKHKVVPLDQSILEIAAEMCIKDGHPNNAIQFIHEKALEEVAKLEYVERISDGTRRDDRVPLLDQRRTRSLEDRFNVQYIRPLLGLGYKTIRELTEKLFVIEVKESEKLEKSDYEVELRYLLRNKGIDPLMIFPKRHLQSRVLGWKKEKAHL